MIIKYCKMNLIYKNFRILFFIILFTHKNQLFAIENDLDPKNYTEKAEIIIIDKMLEDSIKPNPIMTKNKIFKYRNIEITLESCWKSPKDENENSAMILVNEIISAKRRIKTKDHQINNAKEKNLQHSNSGDEQEQYEIENSKINKIFHGWLFTNNRGVFHLDHPIYQVYLLKCV